VGKKDIYIFAPDKKSEIRMDSIRNFCIIAHIDHGKSTLADRLLEKTNTITEREYQDQVLDDMDLERERGITIKSHAIQMEYIHEGRKYILNLIDTPGHVDFSYEVSRSIAACEGALLVIDATQGIQAQTISNLYMAIDHNLEIIPVLNKMDMANAMPEEVKDQIVDLVGCRRNDIIEASARTGMGIDRILVDIVNRIPPPEGDSEAPLQALIFDSIFNSFRGIIAYFKIVNGTIIKGDRVQFLSTGHEYNAEEIGVLKLKQSPREVMGTGDVGYIITGVKNSVEVRVGDTITHVINPCEKAISGFEEVKPMVFAGMYPVDADEYEDLRSSIEKLQLNDASLSFIPESSAALGFGFRCGFLGLLHMEIVQERLDREFDMDVITTVPNVSFKVYTTKGEEIDVHNPSGLPAVNYIERIEEPYIIAQVITLSDYVGPIMNLCIDKRGVMKGQVYLTRDRVELTFEMPLSEIVFDFYDKLKSISKGYASFDYYYTAYQKADLVRLDILLNGEMVDALSTLIYRGHAYDFGRRMCEKLKELIPRQQFDIAIQAAIGAKIIARETVKAVRKDVTAKCYGGDITRKRKLLEKQKKGKKRMRQIGNVEVPQQAFLAVLKLD
jgi:GTP-binding protein LepA